MTSKILEPVCEYYFNPRNSLLFGNEVLRALTEFWDEQTPLPEAGLYLFSDWFLFDFPLFGKESALANFCRANPLRLAEKETDLYKKILLGNRFDFFEVSEDCKKDILELTAMHGGERFKVRVKKTRRLPGKGGVIICRIIPVGDFYEIASVDPIAMDKPTAKDKMRMRNEFPVSDSKIIFHEIIKPDLVPDIKMATEQFGDGKTLFTAGEVGGKESDGCPVCVLMEKAKAEGRQPTEKEMQKAFEEANKKPHGKR